MTLVRVIDSVGVVLVDRILRATLPSLDNNRQHPLHQYAIALATPKRQCFMKSANVDAAPDGAASFSAAASSGCLCQALKTRCFVIGNTVSRLPIA